MKYNLEREGYEVISAADGLVGLSLARKEKPDIIVLDVILPNIDGFMICNLLKCDRAYQHIPIIMLTGSIGEENEKISNEAKANVFMTKPYKPEALLAKIKELIEK
jgi:DNA-binding response OmpR family regulator